MGYYITQQDTLFNMKAENKPKALKALKAISTQTDKMGGGYFDKGIEIRHFSWCDMSYVNDSDFETAFKKLRWDTEDYQDEEGNIIHVDFKGEKLGGDEIFILNAIAPFVKPGSFIQMYGEDGEIWRWVFDGKTCKEVNANITWK